MTSMTNYVRFSIPKITTELNKKGEEKKVLENLPSKWEQLNKDNYKKYLNQEHNAVCLLTGKTNNLTVIDFDSVDSYNKMLESYPDLKQYKTIKTKNGVHIYCNYNPNVLQTTNGLVDYDKVDIKNDGGMVFCPPTKYNTLNGDLIVYTDLGGEIMDVPEIIINNLKQNQVQEQNKKLIVVEEETDGKSNDGEQLTAELTPEITAELTPEPFVPCNDYKFMDLCLEKGLFIELADDYKNWIKMGMGLKHTFNNDDIGIELFDRFSQLCPDKYINKADVKKHYDKIVIKQNKPITLGSIKKWAKDENKDIYDEICNIIKPKKLKKPSKPLPEVEIDWKCLGESDYSKSYKNIIHNGATIYFTGEGNDLDGYEFNGVYWKPLPLHNAELHQTHFDTLYEHYKEKLNELENSLDLDDKDHKNYYNSALEKVNKLKTFATRNNILKIYKRDNYKSNIKWNQNQNLFIFEDAVYNLEKGEFEKPNPDDFMNYSSGLEYKINATKQELDDATVEQELDDATVEIEKFLKSIVEKENYDYLMTFLASFLKQENKDELAHFWLGQGRNGKGTLADLISNSLGLYWGELSIDYYTQYDKGTDRPNQNLYNCRNSRVLNTSEIGENNNTGNGLSFITDKFKRITGSDIISVRELGTKNIANFKAGTVLIQTNVMATFLKMSISLRERIRVVPFPYTFTDDKELLKDQTKYKQKDSSLKKKLTTDIYRIAFTNMLFTFYKTYLEKGLIMTESIRKETLSYFASQTLDNWIKENCELADDKSSVNLNFIKSGYKNDTGKNMSIKQIRDELNELKYKTTDRCLKGWKEKDNGEEDDEHKNVV